MQMMRRHLSKEVFSLAWRLQGLSSHRTAAAGGGQIYLRSTNSGALPPRRGRAAQPPRQSMKNLSKNDRRGGDAWARLKRERQFLDSQLDMSSIRPGRLQTALYFFTSRATKEMAMKNDGMAQIPTEYSRKIFHVLNENKNNHNFIRQVVQSEESSCFGVVKLLHLFLDPFRGTAFSKRTFGHRRRKQTYSDEKPLFLALQDASKVYDFLQELLSKNNKNFVYDIRICNAILELWYYRCGYIAFFGLQNIEPEKLESAFGHNIHSARDCLAAAEQLILQMETNRQVYPEPNEFLYATFLRTFAVSGIEDAADRAREHVERLEEKGFQVPSLIYDAVLMAYANQARQNPEVIDKANELWFEMLQKGGTAKPTRISFSILVNANSSTHKPEQTERLLQLVEDAPEDMFSFSPTTAEYNMAINSYAKSRHPDALQKAQDLFHRMLELSESGANPRATPDKITYTVLMDALVRSPKTDTKGLDLAESLLNHAESGANPNMTPDAAMYEVLMKGLLVRLTNQSDIYAKGLLATRIETLLQRMEKRAESSNSFERPNTKDYNLCFQAWAESQAEDAIPKALNLFRKMEQDYQESNDPTILPDEYTFQALLACLGHTRRGGPGAVSLARELMLKMEQRGIVASVYTINMFLRVLSENGVPEQAEQILQNMERQYESGVTKAMPLEPSYVPVMNGYAKAVGGAIHAERLLRQMISLSEEQPNRMSVAPSSVSYTVVLDAWARSGRQDALENVERIFAEAEQRVLPTSYLFTAYVNALSRSKRAGAPAKAEALLHRMQSDFMSGKNPYCKPTVTTYATVIKCWAEAEEESGERALGILLKMKELYHSGHHQLHPNASCYRYATKALIKQKSMDRAIELVQQLNEAVALGKVSVQHVSECCRRTLIALKDDEVVTEKAKKARSLLNQLKEWGTVLSKDYGYVLQVCGSIVDEEERKTALEVAEMTFGEYVDSGLSLDEYVFSEMILVYNALLADDLSSKEEAISTLWRKFPVAIRASTRVLRVLRGVITPQLYMDLALL